MDYSRLVALVVEAVKRLATENKAMREEIAALQQNVKRLAAS